MNSHSLCDQCMHWSFFFSGLAEIERVLLRQGKKMKGVLEKYVEAKGYRAGSLNSKNIEVEEEI